MFEQLRIPLFFIPKNEEFIEFTVCYVIYSQWLPASIETSQVILLAIAIQEDATTIGLLITFYFHNLYCLQAEEILD
jgi:hypothetical protein